MPKATFGAVAMMLCLAVGVSAQGHNHGGQAQSTDSVQAADSSQGMMQQRMQQMQERRESMQQMRQMHMQQGGMQGMQNGQQERAQAMQGAGGQQTRARDQSCIASSEQAGFAALLTGPVADLGLTESQRAELQEILADARNEALGLLSPEQRRQLEAAPATTPQCQQDQQRAQQMQMNRTGAAAN